MKKILFLLIVSLAFASCDKKDLPEPKGELNPNAMITIRPAKGVQLRSASVGLTALEIVQQAFNIKWQSNWVYETYRTDEALKVARGFPSEFKDLSSPALKMRGIDVISEDGDYQRIFTHGFSIYITDVNNDTIAYVPDSVIENARPLIEAAFAEENYDEVYRLFNEAFTFLPIE